uniref:Uncharacterized protein n=1 Tax=Acrobeloides nanus TaxID=290746 RepID=A0A914EIG4_9BILA
MKLTNKLTLQGIFLVTILVILLFIPQPIFVAIPGVRVCKIELFQPYYWSPDTCSSIYYIIYTYSDGLIAICCVTLDILC